MAVRSVQHRPLVHALDSVARDVQVHLNNRGSKSHYIRGLNQSDQRYAIGVATLATGALLLAAASYLTSYDYAWATGLGTLGFISAVVGGLCFSHPLHKIWAFLVSRRLPLGASMPRENLVSTLREGNHAQDQ